MKHMTIPRAPVLFRLLLGSRSVQVALMVLKPGQSTGEPHNEHPRSEQWLLVCSGRGRARVGRRRVSLKKNSLLLIEKREIHQIVNTGKVPLVTLNFYSPPAYRRNGEPR